MNKITEGELQELQELKVKLNNIIQNLGEIKINKHILENQEKKLLNDFENIQNSENILKDILVKKYGDNISINIETGEY